jgi:alpha-1,3-glucosyltransferase
MELTTNYPVEDWYKAEADYWKLDYPPLTAWHSFIFGLLSKLWEADSMELGKSRGYYSPSHLVFMRLSVMISEILIYLPAILLYFYRTHGQVNEKIRNVALIAVLLAPPFVLIDYGHFQYNNVMLGFALMSVVFTNAGSFSMAAAGLALSFNFKIMGLYYFFPLVCYWVAGVYDRSYRGRLRNGPGLAVPTQFYLFLSGFFAVAGAGFVVSCLIWTPWLGWEEGLEVLGRVFPLDRGVFEDKVATFWCVSSVVVKYKKLFSVRTMTALTTFVTIVLSAPWLYLTVLKRKMKKSLVFGTAGVALTFFLFSYHVHEKTILVPLMPVMLVTVFDYPDLFEVMIVTSTFSMYPLLALDRLKMPYFVFQVGFLALSKVNKDNLKAWVQVRTTKWIYLVMTLVHLTEFIDVPGYPYFFELVIAGCSFLVFSVIWGVLLVQFWKLKHETELLGKTFKDKTR